MEKLFYVGDKAEIFIPAINKVVKKGNSFETTKEIADSLKLQGCFSSELTEIKSILKNKGGK